MSARALTDESKVSMCWEGAENSPLDQWDERLAGVGWVLVSWSSKSLKTKTILKNIVYKMFSRVLLPSFGLLCYLAFVWFLFPKCF